MWRLFSRQVRRTLPTEIFPSGLQEGWQQATYLNCNLVMAELSPDDGEGDVEIWRFGDCFLGKFAEH